MYKKTLEESLASEFSKRLKNRYEEILEYISKDVLDTETYTKNVGYLKALRDMEEYFEEVRELFFPKL